MARLPPPSASPYDKWLKDQRDTHEEAAAEVSRLDREIGELTTVLDGLFTQRTEQMALRDHTAKTISLDPAEYREATKHGAWTLVKADGNAD